MLTVLIADDDELCRDMLAIIVRRALADGDADFSLTSVCDGADAIAVIAARPHDLIVTDLNMPGATGLEVIQAARRARSSASIVLLSGGLDEENTELARAAGAFECLRKPFNVDELRACVRAAAAHSILSAQRWSRQQSRTHYDEVASTAKACAPHTSRA